VKLLNCKVVLHSIFRQSLPAHTKGEVIFEFSEGDTLADILSHFDLPEDAVCVLNNQIENDKKSSIKDGDILHIFRPAPVW